jgi:hypothetical protein
MIRRSDMRGWARTVRGITSALALAALLGLGSAANTNLGTGAVIVAASSVDALLPVAETSAAGRDAVETIGAVPAATDEAILALLADGRLLAVDRDGGRVIAEAQLFDLPSGLEHAPGHYLALGRDGTRLFVLLANNADPSGGSRLAAVDPATLRVLAPNLLAESDVAYRSLAVGPSTGRLYLFGNRGRDAVVAVHDPDGRPLVEWPLRGSDGHEWSVYQGAVDAAERRLYVSYHGVDTTGVDSFDLVPGVRRCAAPGQDEGRGCIPAHGGVLPYGDSLLVATGQPAIVEMGSDGTVSRVLETGLKGNHLMEFVVDERTDRLYAVGSCGYTGGFAAIDLQPRSSAVAPGLLVPPQGGGTAVAADVPCGERFVLGPSGVVVARTATPIARADARGALLTVDVSTGEVVGRVETPAEPLDLIALPSRVARFSTRHRAC